MFTTHKNSHLLKWLLTYLSVKGGLTHVYCGNAFVRRHYKEPPSVSIICNSFDDNSQIITLSFLFAAAAAADAADAAADAADAARIEQAAKIVLFIGEAA